MTDRYRSASGRDAVRAWCRARLQEWPVPHERREVDSCAGRTHLLLAGDGAATVLYLPGTNSGAATSLAVTQALARQARVVVADLPGQPGLSDGRRPPTLAAHGAWVGELVQQLGRPGRPLVLVGHSLGAAVALAAPTSGVHGLVLLDPAGLVRLRVPLAVLRTTVLWLARPTEARSARLVRHLSGPGVTADRHWAEWMTLVSRHTVPVGAPGPLSSGATQPWTRVPRAVLSGEADCFLPPARLRGAVRQRLQAELVTLPGRGHLLPDEDPAAVVTAVRGVLSLGDTG